MLILVTRPGDAGQGLTTRLGALGWRALWWPAFDILPPVDDRPLQVAVTRPGHYDLVVFVSPIAVRAWAAAAALAPASGAWPEHTRIAAVGGATRHAAAEIPGTRGATLIGPEGQQAGEGGTEALWPRLAALVPPAREVLIVRAQSGRDWLARQLARHGAHVDELVAYRRLAHEASDADWSALHAALGGVSDAADAREGTGLAVLFSSTEAVAPVTQSLLAHGVPMDHAGPSVALCVHARIADAAHRAGWQHVACCDADADAIATALAASPMSSGRTGAAPIAPRP